MATIGTLKQEILREELQDEGQFNYLDPEVWGYFNKALDVLSREIAKFQHSIGLLDTTLTYSIGDYSESLPTGFLKLAKHKGEHRVFNVTNNSSRMNQASAGEVDGYEVETASDKGTPSVFYFQGNNLLIHPRPEVETTVKLYYFGVETISGDADTVPWNGIFDRAIKSFVVSECRLRSEMVEFFQVDQLRYQALRRAAHGIMLARDGGFEASPAQGFGHRTYSNRGYR